MVKVDRLFGILREYFCLYTVKTKKENSDDDGYQTCSGVLRHSHLLQVIATFKTDGMQSNQI